MNISGNKYDAIENLIFNEGLRINSVEFSNALDKMTLNLTKNLVFIIPIKLFASLKNANKQTLSNFKLTAGGTGIYWPDLDEDLSLKGFLKDYLKQQIRSEKELVLS